MGHRLTIGFVAIPSTWHRPCRHITHFGHTMVMGFALIFLDRDDERQTEDVRCGDSESRGVITTGYACEIATRSVPIRSIQLRTMC